MKPILFYLLLLPAFCQAQGGWKYSTGKDFYAAGLLSANKLTFEVPNEAGERATIAILNIDGKNEASLLVPGAQFVTVDNRKNIIIQFDKNGPETFSCNNLPARKPDHINIEDAEKFIARLKRAKSIVIKTTFTHEGEKAIEFNVAGLKWEH